MKLLVVELSNSEFEEFERTWKACKRPSQKEALRNAVLYWTLKAKESWTFKVKESLEQGKAKPRLLPELNDSLKWLKQQRKGVC